MPARPTTRESSRCKCRRRALGECLLMHISPVCLDGRLGQKSGGLSTLANGSVAPLPDVYGPPAETASNERFALLISICRRSGYQWPFAARSWACPGVSEKANGLPRASTKAWDFCAQSAAAAADRLVFIIFGSAGAVLVRPDDGAVDHGVFVVGLCGQVLKQPFPHPGLGPAAKPPVRILPITKALRQITPGNSSTVAIDNRFDESTIVLSGCADMTDSPRQQVLDALPWVVAQSVAGHRVSLLQSRPATNYTNVCEGRPFFTDYARSLDSLYVCRCSN